jgi:hypothetical protein
MLSPHSSSQLLLRRSFLSLWAGGLLLGLGLGLAHADRRRRSVGAVLKLKDGGVGGLACRLYRVEVLSMRGVLLVLVLLVLAVVAWEITILAFFMRHAIVTRTSCCVKIVVIANRNGHNMLLLLVVLVLLLLLLVVVTILV